VADSDARRTGGGLPRSPRGASRLWPVHRGFEGLGPGSWAAWARRPERIFFSKTRFFSNTRTRCPRSRRRPIKGDVSSIPPGPQGSRRAATPAAGSGPAFSRCRQPAGRSLGLLRGSAAGRRRRMFSRPFRVQDRSLEELPDRSGTRGAAYLQRHLIASLASLKRHSNAACALPTRSYSAQLADQARATGAGLRR
jgi:hypothetical protein